MAKLSFQQPVLQASVLHDTSDIIYVWFGAKETLLIIIVENHCPAYYFVETEKIAIESDRINRK